MRRHTLELLANPKVAWKLQASNAAAYSVRPWSGTLASGDEVSVGITVKGGAAPVRRALRPTGFPTQH